MSVISKFETLYKRSTDGSIQEWRMERNGDMYRTVSGQWCGKMVESTWKKALPKNVGKSNETTGEEQAILEIEARYTKQKKLAYTNDMDSIDNEFYFSPMLAKNYEDYDLDLDNNCITLFSQPKLDGVRAIVSAKGMFSRKGEPLITAPHILEDLQDLFDARPNLILDGELYNHDLKDDFNTLLSLVKKKKPTVEDLIKSEEIVQYHIYDYFSASNFEERIDDLRGMFNKFSLTKSNIIKLVDTHFVEFQDELDSLYGKYNEAGYEGQMVRISKEGYENKRSKYLLKRKEFITEEFRIIRIEVGEGNRSEVAGRVYVHDEENNVSFKAGIRGSFEFCKKLLEEADSYVNGSVTIRFQNRTPDNIPRFPVAIAFYEGERNI